jgi:NAD(P)-dependent dehydrogenase (short-subunit alcohol dehydrogenase family)
LHKKEKYSLNHYKNGEEPVALITGSTSGIGVAIARRLSKEGYAVVLHSRSSSEKGIELANEFENAIYIQADLSKDDDRIRLISQTISWKGQLNVLVNNAGMSQIIPHDDLLAASPSVWNELYEVNAIAPFRLIAEAEIYLRNAAKHGQTACVINISSHAGVRPKGASIPYAASKAALNHITRLLAVSLAPDIRVNGIAPGLVSTPLTQSWISAQQHWNEQSPMKRAAKPEDIAQIVSMLIASNYVTGEIILADGGLNLK